VSVTQSTDQMITAAGRRALTTSADHNGARRRPIPADAPVAQSQVDDYARQSGRILQVEGH
jgi:hypothetical protein